MHKPEEVFQWPQEVIDAGMDHDYVQYWPKEWKTPVEDIQRPEFVIDESELPY